MTNSPEIDARSGKTAYNRFLLLVSGLGGLPCGIDIGIIQFMLTFVIVVVAFIGDHYTRNAETAIAQANGNETEGVFDAVIRRNPDPTEIHRSVPHCLRDSRVQPASTRSSGS